MTGTETKIKLFLILSQHAKRFAHSPCLSAWENVLQEGYAWSRTSILHHTTPGYPLERRKLIQNPLGAQKIELPRCTPGRTEVRSKPGPNLALGCIGSKKMNGRVQVSLGQG